MVGGVIIGLFIGNWFAGRLPAFDPTLESLREEAVTRDEDPYRGVWSFLAGRSWLVQGRIADAIPALRESAAVMRLRDPGMMLPWCLAALTQALCAADEAAGARAALRDLEAVHHDVVRHIEVEVGLARAWAAATDGSREEGTRLAVEVGRTHHADGRLALAALAYHDALRLGAPAGAVVDELDELATLVAGPVVAAMAAHARAVATADRHGLEASGVAFESVGMLLHAAEAIATASVVAAGEGRRATAGELRARASTLADHCGTALTPLLEPISDRKALGILTRKEQEVALMAARGMTKRQIAAALSVSIRTVGNHINHAYGKLGVSTRDELRAVLRVRYASTENSTVTSSSS
jgi:DNA-binding CsgD family transcriptional regulator